jgi:hypothetical protein
MNRNEIGGFQKLLEDVRQKRVREIEEDLEGRTSWSKWMGSWCESPWDRRLEVA